MNAPPSEFKPVLCMQNLKSQIPRRAIILQTAQEILLGDFLTFLVDTIEEVCSRSRERVPLGKIPQAFRSKKPCPPHAASSCMEAPTSCDFFVIQRGQEFLNADEQYLS